MGVLSSQPGEAAAGLAASSSTAGGGAVAKDFSQLTGAGRGAGLTLTCHVSAATVGDRPGEEWPRRILKSDLFMLYQ